MANSRIFLKVVLPLFLASVSYSQVTISWIQGSQDNAGSGVSHTLSNLSGSVTLATDPVLSWGALSSDLFSTPSTGFIEIVYDGRLSFDPNDFASGTDSGGNSLRTNSSGLGIAGGSNGNNAGAGDALLLTFNFTDLTAGAQVVVTGYSSGINGLQLWEDGASSASASGSTVAGQSIVIEDGDTIALYVASGAGRIGSYTLDIIPEPSSFGMIAGIGAAVLVLTRRKKRIS
ncbi:MAG: PEP-CTERM sorting domain-containing protein [Verrucomicrobiota bacterium]